MYVTLERIQSALSLDVLLYLTDDERQGAVADDAGPRLPDVCLDRVAAKLADANAEVDSYVGQRYALPLPAVPDVLAAKATDLAVYKLFLRRGLRPNTADEAVAMAYKDAVSWLKDVALGRASLPVPAAGEGSAGTVRPGGAASVTAADRVFSRETLKDF